MHGARELRRKRKGLHVGLEYAYACAIEAKDPSVIEDRWLWHRCRALLDRGGESSCKKRNKKAEDEEEELLERGRTDEYATGKSYRDSGSSPADVGDFASFACTRVRVHP